MSLPTCKELLIKQDNGVIYITLNRPQKRNAMNLGMVAEIMQVVDAVADDRGVRAIVFQGADGNFCAGGDISGMNSIGQEKSKGETRDASWHFNRSFGHLIKKVNQAPQLIICVLEGAVLGGGFGLACVSDYAIAKKDAQFAMPETGLGIIPAQIAPFVVARIGLTHARRLTLFGERINGVEAWRLGVVHQVCKTDSEMQSELDKSLKLLRSCAPNATAITKQLILDTVDSIDLDGLLDRASDDFSVAICSEEGQEGTTAFIEKRRPSWSDDEPS